MFGWAIDWRRRRGWLIVGVELLCLLVVAWLIFAAALDKKMSVWGWAGLLFLSLVSIELSVVIAIERGHDPRQWNRRQWFGTPGVILVIGAELGWLAMASGALPLFPPRISTENYGGETRDAANAAKENSAAILRKLDTSRPTLSMVEYKLPGIWGDADCAVTYRFAIEGKSLRIVSERGLPGGEVWHGSGTIVSAQGNVMETNTEEPRKDRGIGASFSYWSNGRTERLTWRNKATSEPVEMERCA